MLQLRGTHALDSVVELLFRARAVVQVVLYYTLAAQSQAWISANAVQR